MNTWKNEDHRIDQKRAFYEGIPLRLLGKHPKIRFSAFSLLLFVMSFLLGYLLSQPFTMQSKDLLDVGVAIGSTGSVMTYPRLVIQISPPGYPLPGKQWKASVFKVDKIQDYEAYRPALNSSVIVSLYVDGEKKVFNLSVDEHAEVMIEYRPEYSDVAFQAYSGTVVSMKVILAKHFRSPEAINNLRWFNMLALLATISGGISTLRERAKKLMLALFLPALLLNVFVALFLGLASKATTEWGIPEKVIGELITIGRLEIAFFIGSVITLVALAAFIIMKIGRFGSQ